MIPFLPFESFRRRLCLAAGAAAWVAISSGLAGCSGSSVMNASGRGYYNNGQYAAARAEFAKASAADPENPDYAYNLARAMQAEGNLRGAEYQFRRAIKNDPRHQPSYHHLSQMMADQGRGNEAMQMLTGWSGSQPFVAESHLEVAALQKRLGDLPAAETSLQQALAVRPNHPKALAHLGEVYQQTGRPQEAVAAYSQALKGNPAQPQLQSRIAMLTTPASNPTAPGNGPDAQLTGLDSTVVKTFAPTVMPQSPRQSLALLGRTPGQLPAAVSPAAGARNADGTPLMSLAGLPLAQPVHPTPVQRVMPQPQIAPPRSGYDPSNTMIAARPTWLPLPRMASQRRPMPRRSPFNPYPEANAWAGAPVAATPSMSSMPAMPVRHEARSFGRPLPPANPFAAYAAQSVASQTTRPVVSGQALPRHPLPQNLAPQYTAPRYATPQPVAYQVPPAVPPAVPSLAPSSAMASPGWSSPQAIQQVGYEIPASTPTAAATPTVSGPTLPPAALEPVPATAPSALPTAMPSALPSALPPALQSAGKSPRVITPLPSPGWKANAAVSEPPTLSSF